MPSEHVHTDRCGYDRSSSVAEDRYVCTCGWSDGPIFTEYCAPEGAILTLNPEPSLEKDVIFTIDGPAPVEVLRLDREGMVYKGERILDAGAAHRAFLEVMNLMQLNLKG